MQDRPLASSRSAAPVSLIQPERRAERKLYERKIPLSREEGERRAAAVDYLSLRFDLDVPIARPRRSLSGDGSDRRASEDARRRAARRRRLPAQGRRQISRAADAHAVQPPRFQYRDVPCLARL